MAIAVASSAAALILTVFTVWLTAPWLRIELPKLRADLDACTRDRASLRAQVSILSAALARLLPEHERARLERALDEAA